MDHVHKIGRCINVALPPTRRDCLSNIEDFASMLVCVWRLRASSGTVTVLLLCAALTVRTWSSANLCIYTVEARPVVCLASFSVMRKLSCERCDKVHSGGNMQISWMSPWRGGNKWKLEWCHCSGWGRGGKWQKVCHFKREKRMKWVYNSRWEKRNDSRLEWLNKLNSRLEVCDKNK